MAGKANTKPFTARLPDELPPVDDRPGALVDLVKALADVDLDDHSEGA
jgi:hypothetical protein